MNRRYPIAGWMLACPLALLGATGLNAAEVEVSDVLRALSLRDYNTRLVVVSSAALGISGGLIGGFLLLRKRSLMGDTLSHATLPGIAIAFLLQVALGGDGKNLGGLLFGAALFAVLGSFLVMKLRETPRIKDDAAMGIVLSVFFGFGVVLLGMIQTMPSGSAAGLERFIYGKAASMVFGDFIMIASVAGVALLVSLALTKEFRILCFDEGYAASQGWPVKALDAALLGLVTAVTVAGLHAVGLILVIAFLITPAAAARFWTDSLPQMLGLAATFGGVSGWFGASISAVAPGAPAGAIIVLVAAGLFGVSLFFGSKRGAALRWRRESKLKASIRRQHLLRAAYEWLERKGASDGKSEVVNFTIPMEDLVAARSWNHLAVMREAKRAYDRALVARFDQRALLLSDAGLEAAAKATRNHRLWEMYLIENADIAPSHVDRDADAVEHVLGEEMVARLESLMGVGTTPSGQQVPSSPHS